MSNLDQNKIFPQENLPSQDEDKPIDTCNNEKSTAEADNPSDSSTHSPEAESTNDSLVSNSIEVNAPSDKQSKIKHKEKNSQTKTEKKGTRRPNNPPEHTAESVIHTKTFIKWTKLEEDGKLQFGKRKNGNFDVTFIKGVPGHEENLINFLIKRNNKAANGRKRMKLEDNAKNDTTIDDSEQTIILNGNTSNEPGMEALFDEEQNQSTNIKGEDLIKQLQGRIRERENEIKQIKRTIEENVNEIKQMQGMIEEIEIKFKQMQGIIEEREKKMQTAFDEMVKKMKTEFDEKYEKMMANATQALNVSIKRRKPRTAPSDFTSAAVGVDAAAEEEVAMGAADEGMTTEATKAGSTAECMTTVAPSDSTSAAVDKTSAQELDIVPTAYEIKLRKSSLMAGFIFLFRAMYERGIKLSPRRNTPTYAFGQLVYSKNDGESSIRVDDIRFHGIRGYFLKHIKNDISTALTMLVKQLHSESMYPEEAPVLEHFQHDVSTIKKCSQCRVIKQVNEQQDVCLKIQLRTEDINSASFQGKNLKKVICDHFWTVPSDNKQCETCPHNPDNGLQALQITKLPTFFAIAFNCFDENDCKLRSLPKIDLQDTLDLNVFAHCNVESTQYVLMCAVYHCGNSVHEGWFDTYAKENATAESCWRFHDGSYSCASLPNTVLRKQIGKMRSSKQEETLCMLVYEKKTPDRIPTLRKLCERMVEPLNENVEGRKMLRQIIESETRHTD
jgi:hypothetical protein